MSIRRQYRGIRTPIRFDIDVIRMASGISGRVRDATRFSARRAHFEMLVNWRGREGRGTKARRVRERRGRLKVRERGGGEPRAKGRHGRPSISRPVLRSFPSAGKSSGARLEHGRCRG